MKKIIKTIKKFFGEIILIIGTEVFFYNVLNFSYEIEYGKIGRIRNGELLEITVAYYYNSDILLLISIGATLTTAGILIIKNKQK